MSAYWHEGLQCEVLAPQYDFERHRAVPRFPEHNCCSMDGAIALAQSICMSVESIWTFSGGVRDTVYFKAKSGVWSAHR